MTPRPRLQAPTTAATFPFVSDPATRTRMSLIRRRDTRPELLLRRELHRRGWRFFVDRPLRDGSRCRPDLLFPRLGVAVFVDGCFWHYCPQHTHLQNANAEYWLAKLLANRQRDARHDAALRDDGWIVVRVWEHSSVDEVVASTEAVLLAASAVNGPGRWGRPRGLSTSTQAPGVSSRSMKRESRPRPAIDVGIDEARAGEWTR